MGRAAFPIASNLSDTRAAFDSTQRTMTTTTTENTALKEIFDEHRFRNVLWKYLGSKEVGEGPEVAAVQVQAGDRFLLCTDGLTGVVPDDQLASEISSATDMQQCAERLGQIALEQGSRDNVSCVVFEVVEG